MKRAEYEGQERRVDAVQRRSRMNVSELADRLQTTEDAVKTMCRGRTRRNSKFPIPYFVSPSGRIMFLTYKIDEWLGKIEAAESAKHDAQATLPRGKRKRVA
jgi:hypothetical protein